MYHYIADDGRDGVQNADDPYGTIKMRLHKELNEAVLDEALEGMLSQVTNDNAEFTTIVNERQNQTFQRYILTIEVIAEWNDLSYNYVIEYFREDKYKVEFSHDGTKIVWDGSKWRIGDTAGPVYDGWNAEGASRIQYKYQIDENPLSVEYHNVHAEAGMTSGLSE